MKKESAMKLLTVSFAVLLLLSMFGSVIAASPQDLQQKASDVTETAGAIPVGIAQGLSKIFTPLFGGSNDTAFLVRIFFGILLFMVLYSVVDVIFKKNRFLTYMVTALITIISMWSIPAEFLSAMTLQYGAMGAAILTVIPFMIMLVFTVRVGSLLAARMLWIFYCFYYFGLYIYGFVVANNTSAGWTWTNSGYIYLIFLVLGLCMFLLVGPIRSAVFKGELAGVREEGKVVAGRAKLLHKLQKEELEESYGGGSGI